MDQATLQSRIYAGYGKAAIRLGATCNQYRAVTASNPTAPQNLVGTLLAAFDTKPAYDFGAPSAYGKPQWFGLFDATNVEVGDYLIDPTGATWFVASLEPIHPPLCIRCNTILTVVRPAPSPPGAEYYGGSRTQSTPLMTDWPAAVIQGTRGEKGDTQLPGDARLPYQQIYMPAFAGVTLRSSDIATDTEGQAFTLSSVELTALGYRMTAQLTVT